MTRVVRVVGEVLWGTFRRWFADRCHGLGAGMSYYAILAAPSFIILVFSILFRIFDPQQVVAHLEPYLAERLNPQAMELARYLIVDFAHYNPKNYTVPTFGLVVLGLSMGGFCVQLKESIDTIFEIRMDPVTIEEFISEESWTLILSALFGIAGGLSLVVRIVGKKTYMTMFGAPGPLLLAIADYGLQFLIFATLSLFMFSTIPKPRPKWKDIVPGACITGLLIVIGRAVVAKYLDRQDVSHLSGMAGTLLAFLVWCYFFSQAFLIGAEFTREIEDRKKKSRGEEPRRFVA